MGKAAAQAAFSHDGRFVYASLNGTDAVAKVDMAARELVGTVAVGDGPIQTSVSGDYRYLLVANQGTEESPETTVSVIRHQDVNWALRTLRVAFCDQLMALAEISQGRSAELGSFS